MIEGMGNRSVKVSEFQGFRASKLQILNLLRDENFASGCTLADDVDAAKWQEEWAAICEVCDDLIVGLDGYDSDLQTLSQLAIECQTVHHSDSYREAYNPHYRIVHRSLLYYIGRY